MRLLLRITSQQGFQDEPWWPPTTAFTAVIAVTAVVIHVGLTLLFLVRTVHRSQKTQYTYEGDQGPSIRAVDDRPAMGNHARYGVRPARSDDDSHGARMLPPHGGAMWKFNDAGQSFLLQGSRTNKHCSSPGAGCRADSSSHNCCDTARRLVRSIARGNSALPSFVSACSTSRTFSRL